MVDGTHNQVELDIVSVVPNIGPGELLAKVGDGVVFLAQNCAYSNLRGAIMEEEWLLEVGEDEDWRTCQFRLDEVE